jgi:hypothetical protein
VTTTSSISARDEPPEASGIGAHYGQLLRLRSDRGRSWAVPISSWQPHGSLPITTTHMVRYRLFVRQGLFTTFVKCTCVSMSSRHLLAGSHSSTFRRLEPHASQRVIGPGRMVARMVMLLVFQIKASKGHSTQNPSDVLRP